MTTPPESTNPQADMHVEPEWQRAQYAMQSGDWAGALVFIEQLLHRHPKDELLLALREECRFKADFDKSSTFVKPKMSTHNWRRMVARGLVTAAALLVVLLGVTVTRARLLPLMAESQGLKDRQMILQSAQVAFARQEWTEAETYFNQLLSLDPESSEAAEGLAAVAHERDLASRYQTALQLLVGGESDAALTSFSSLQFDAPNYRDVNSRILEARSLSQLDLLYAQAQVQIQLGYNALALATFNEIQSTSTDYKRQEVEDALFRLNVNEGRAMLMESPAQVAVALSYFDAALRQRPSDIEAIADQRLASAYLKGRDAYNSGEWSTAITQLGTVFGERPGYLGDSLPPLLYQAYINYGDQLRAADDLYMAYDRYRLAAELPVADTVVARGRMDEIGPLLTPTPTPAPTATEGPTAAPSTPTPTATPQPLLTFQGRIVFKSDNPDASGYWAMDANGGNRTYLGTFEQYDAVVEAYRETERLSPDGQYRVQVGSVDGRAQILFAKTFDPTFAPKVLTRLGAISYDPVWAPDGSMVAFVTQEHGTDDIWLISPDGARTEDLVRNEWEWDKQPSWSRDSTRIAFMSNREGTEAIWVMERTGRNPHNISNVPWPEYEPVWIK